MTGDGGDIEHRTVLPVEDNPPKHQPEMPAERGVGIGDSGRAAQGAHPAWLPNLGEVEGVVVAPLVGAVLVRVAPDRGADQVLGQELVRGRSRRPHFLKPRDGPEVHEDEALVAPCDVGTVPVHLCRMSDHEPEARSQAGITLRLGS